VTSIPGRLFDPGIYRPVVDILLVLPNGHQRILPAVVDSGADDTTIPAKVLEADKIPWSSLKPAPIPQTQGVGGTVEQRICPAAVKYGGRTFCTKVIVVRELNFPVVGRSDFFKTFTVNFDGWAENPPYFDIERR
jgi:predicted aspartyl protease